MTPVIIDVHVIPRAKKTQLAGAREGAVLIRLAAPPVEGAANDALVDFLATVLDLPRRNIRIISGQHARHKRVAISASSVASVRSRLGV